MHNLGHKESSRHEGQLMITADSDQQFSMFIFQDETYHFLRTHITGAISHGSGRIFTFIDLMRWPHDSNLTLNVLLRIFLEIAEVHFSSRFSSIYQ